MDEFEGFTNEGLVNDDFTTEEKAEDAQESVLRIRVVHAEKYYDVWIVKFDESPMMSYAVINRDTGIIEAVQPVLYNAKIMAKQFGAWLDGEDEDKESRIAEALRIMKGNDKETH